MTTPVGALREALEAVADPARAEPMAAYMKGHFTFLGVGSGPRRAASREFIAQARQWGSDELTTEAEGLWHEPEREFQYVGADMLRRWVRNLEADSIDDLAWLITTKSWWDTVDTLAAHTVGPLVAANEELVAVMDEWIEDDNMWLNRSALLYQLTFKERTDIDRLFRYCLIQRTRREFFIRKAIGWALRQQAKQTPERVARFVAEHDFSPLTTREALKHLNQPVRSETGQPTGEESKRTETNAQAGSNS